MTLDDGAIRTLAKTKWHVEGGDIEIDDDASVSRPDDPKATGCYVQAWVWVDFPDDSGGFIDGILP